MKTLFSNLNARLMAVHFVAFCLFILAFESFAFFHDYTFLYAFSEHMNRLNFPARFNADMIFIDQAGNIGLLAAYVISWTICSKREWHWINSVVIFLLAFAVKNYLIPNWTKVNAALVRPGGLFKIYNVWGHAGLGLGLLAVGLAIFFSKKVIIFITGDKPANKKGQKPKAVRA